METRNVPVFILRDQKKVFVGEATVHEEENGTIVVGKFNEILYVDHPTRGDLEINEQPRFICSATTRSEVDK